MARKIKWRLQFKSLNNTGCLVNIYEEGYTASQADTTKTGVDVPFAVETGVTELTGAAVPFEFEDDDSHDLTEFIRFKTGYINLIETTYGELNDLYPASIHHHFVEAFYGTERVFTGFMQCQEFDDAWVATPREMSFPVVSPLGLLSAYNFTAPNEPGLVTLGTLMHEVMTVLNPAANNTNDSDYSYVITPSAGSEYKPWSDKMNSLVVCPFNSAFEHYDDIAKLYDPQDFAYFVEGICACYGWMVHDTPSAIVFSKFDFSGSYYARLTVAGLLSLNSGFDWLNRGVERFDNYYSNADNNATKSVVMPLKKITLTVEGSKVEDKQLTTRHTKTPRLAMMAGGSNFRALALQQSGPDVDGPNLGVARFGGDGNVYSPGLFPIAYGKIESGAFSVDLQENYVIKYSSSWGSIVLLTAKFYGVPPRGYAGGCLLKLKMERGTSMQDLQSTGYNSIQLNLVIKSGGKYYSEQNNTWYDTITSNTITIDGTTGKVTPNSSLTAPIVGAADDMGDVDGFMFNPEYNMFGCIEVSLYNTSTSGLNDGDILRITEMSLVNPESIRDDYFADYYGESEIEIGNNKTGTDSKDIAVHFNNYSDKRGEHSFGLVNSGPVISYPTYPYMFQPLHVLTQRVKREHIPTFEEYTYKYIYWISGWNWIMIAKNFNMRDDEYTITLARSSVIE